MRKSRSLPVSKAPLARGLRHILVTPVAGSSTCGKLVLPGGTIPCMLGRGGMTRRKREGDGATPAGRFAIVGLGVRADRASLVRCGLPRRIIQPHDAWCDDPASPMYNRPLRLPCTVSHEAMWRQDGLYDIVLTLDYNLRYPRKRLGSAIFFHLQHEAGASTAGCIAIDRHAMRRLLPRLSRSTVLIVSRSGATPAFVPFS